MFAQAPVRWPGVCPSHRAVLHIPVRVMTLQVRSLALESQDPPAENLRWGSAGSFSSQPTSRPRLGPLWTCQVEPFLGTCLLWGVFVNEMLLVVLWTGEPRFIILLRHPHHPLLLWKEDVELSSSHSSGFCPVLQPMSGAVRCDLKDEHLKRYISNMATCRISAQI